MFRPHKVLSNSITPLTRQASLFSNKIHFETNHMSMISACTCSPLPRLSVKSKMLQWPTGKRSGLTTAVSVSSTKMRLPPVASAPEPIKPQTPMDRRHTAEKLTLNSYLSVCADVGQINRAFNLLVEFSKYKGKSRIDVQHCNIVLKGWAKLGSVAQVVETRRLMVRYGIEPNAETFAYILLAYSKAQIKKKTTYKRVVEEMQSRNIDPRTLFQMAYLDTNERTSVRSLLRAIDPKYEDTFSIEPTDYNNKLLTPLSKVQPVPYVFGGQSDFSNLESWAEHQRRVEWKSSNSIKSIASADDSPEHVDLYTKVWQKFIELWRKTLSKSLDESLEDLQAQCLKSNKVHLYPFLCSLDKNLLVNMMLDEVENNAVFTNYSYSTNTLHLTFGTKIMIRYLKSKAVADGSHEEKQKIYNDYLKEYCRNSELMGKMNSREFFQKRAYETKNYAVYKDRFSPVEQWPKNIVAAIGRFLYGLILRDIKFDISVVRNSNKEINHDKLVPAFYTAYMQIDSSHKIKEEFRAHQDFEKLHQKCCTTRLKFDYSFLPTSTPPMPWLSPGFGGYLTTRSDLVRLPDNYAEKQNLLRENIDYQKLYPSLDSLNAISLCPWIVNKEILDLIIALFKRGGDADLTVPLSQTKMNDEAPVIKPNAGKSDKILFNKERKKYDQKRREMYSLWRDCLYRLSIANHFRDRIFWFPHNMDFRGRTYPIPPHFNHLGSDLARSLLLFAKGQPLGEKGLDWLKIHLINLGGTMKNYSLADRLEYANSILHLEVLDSADNPWDGRRWWTKNDNPWQVLACCKEIAKAIRSRDFRQFVSHFPVHQDGSCNGLQHYAALGRDSVGAKAVNLIPCDVPQDVYRRVVEIVESIRKADAEKGIKVAETLDGYVERKVIKQTVMTIVYGVTRYGARMQIARQLSARGFPDNEIWRAAQYLSTKTFESIGQMFNKSRLIQDWFNNCAFLIASRCKQPVSWETPLGFPITQPYTQPFVMSATRLLSQDLIADVSLYSDPSAKVNAPKQKTAFPPNFIHSLDSSHMMLTSLFCQREGVTFVSVHDCYWTHPNTVDIMNRVCREQFLALHSEPLLKDLSEQFLQKFGHIEGSVKDWKSARNDRCKKGKKLEIQPLASNYYDMMVADDLKALMAEEDELKIDEDEQQQSVRSQVESPRMVMQPLKSMIDVSNQEAQMKIRSAFRDIPEPGDLDLREVLKSTYFFS